MNFDQYQVFAQQNWRPGCDDITFALGLGGETGEVLEILKKARRDCQPPDLKHLAEELGDVLWYVANLCTVFNFSLEAIAELNKKKLTRRYGEIEVYRRNGPHIEQVDPQTGKHIRFVGRAAFTKEQLQQIDDANKQEKPHVETAKVEIEGGNIDDGKDDCPFE